MVHVRTQNRTVMAEADSVVSEECIKELLEFCSKGSFKAKNVDRRNEIIHKMCIHLIARDYEVEVIDNKSGQLCGHYPSELIVIEAHKSRAGHSCRRVNDTAQLKELILTARYARCRSRFVMPVILFEDKNICRSATLSTMAEMYGRAGMDWITGGETSGSAGGRDRVSVPSTDPAEASGAVSGGSRSSSDSEEMELMTRVRGQDVQLLKAVGVELICDLMVEKKKTKYGLLVASSEKVDKWARYCDFQIASMPYPGCEFFRDYKDKGFDPVDLHFDWSQPMINADLLIPEPLQQLTQIQFKAYQDWDLVQITLNYLKLFLTYIRNGKGSLLVHCISGWDRTPLFISLLRLSLWADNRAHCSLSPKEILYFTIAYDWFTFGHPFKERHEKGEEIMFFCFDFLKYMTSDDLSVNSLNSSRTAGHNHTAERSDRGVECSHSLSTSGTASTTPNSTTHPSSPCSSTQLGEGWVVETRGHLIDGPHSKHEASDCYNPCQSQHSSLLHSGLTSRTYTTSVAENQYSHTSHPPSLSTSSHTSHSHPLSLSTSSHTSHSHPSSLSTSSHTSHSHPPSLSTSSHTSHSHPPPLPTSSRRDKLLAVRTLYQQSYRAAVPDVRPQGAVAFATGLLSRITASFSGSSDVQV